MGERRSVCYFLTGGEPTVILHLDQAMPRMVAGASAGVSSVFRRADLDLEENIERTRL